MYPYKHAAYAAILFATVQSVAPVRAPAADDLDQRLRIVERKLENADEAAAAKAKTTPVVTASEKDGFSIASPDAAFKLRLRGYVQFDARFYSGEEAKKFNDTFLLRRVRPIFEGVVGEDVSFRIMPDFGGGTTVLQDAYIDYKLDPAFVVRAGKAKQPFGLERLQSGTDTRFVERGFPTSLGPNRDLGLQIGGVIGDGVVEYALGAFNGTPDGGNSDTDTDDGKDINGRLFLTPFKGSGIDLLEGLSVGAAYSVGDVEGKPDPSSAGVAGANSSLAGFKSPGQQTFFNYRSSATNNADTVYADGDRVRFSPQATWYIGSLGLLGEYVESEHDVSKGDKSATLKHSAWQTAVSYVLTGEDNSFKGVTPLSKFNPKAGTWGALELVGRYGELDVDDASFGDYADPKKSATKASAWSAGLNWYWNRNVKLQADYEVTSYEGGSAKGAKPDEEVVFTRVQIAF
ncbi:MAG: porin [Kiritimatiellia bacterium]